MKEFGNQHGKTQSLVLRGRRLKAIRISREIDIKTAAQKLYMKEEQLSDIEGGKLAMTFEQARAASKLYNVSMQFIAQGICEDVEWQTWKKA